MAALLESHLEVDPVLLARGICTKLTVALERFRRAAEVGEVRVAAAELRPRLQIASAEGQARALGSADEAVHEALWHVVAEGELAQLPIRCVLVVDARETEIGIRAPLA